MTEKKQASKQAQNAKRWNLSFWPVLAFVCVLPGLLWLGAWQVQRGNAKAEAYRDFEQSVAGAARDVTGLPLDEFNELQRYERVTLHGHYLEERGFLLDNMSHKGRPGHHVLVPFQPRDADYLVIVDLGWRPRRAAEAGAGDMKGVNGGGSVSGMLASFPQPALRLDGKPEYGSEWPKVVQFPGAGEFAAMLEQPVAASRLLLDANAAEGFERDWKPPGIPPARHYAYAFQWFGLAVALIVIFIVMARRGRRNIENRKTDQ